MSKQNVEFMQQTFSDTDNNAQSKRREDTSSKPRISTSHKTQNPYYNNTDNNSDDGVDHNYHTDNNSDDGVDHSYHMALYNDPKFRGVMFKLLMAIVLAAAVLIIVALTLNPSTLPGVLPAVVAKLTPMAAHAILGVAVVAGAGSALALGLSVKSSFESHTKAVMNGDKQSYRNRLANNMTMFASMKADRTDSSELAASAQNNESKSPQV